MRLLTNRNTDNLKELANPMVAHRSESTNVVPPYYRLSSPFQLTFITFHPEDLDNYYIITSIAPDYVTYTGLEKQEIERYLSNKMHHHDFYELLFVLEGSLFQRIENQRHLYTAGSCCLLNRNVRHTEEYSIGFRAIFLEISERFLREVFENMSLNYFEIEKQHKRTQLEEFLYQNIYKEKNYAKTYIDLVPVHDNMWVMKNVHHLFEQMTLEILSPQFGSSFLIKGLFFKLLQILDDSDNYETTSMKIGTPSENHVFNEITKLMAETNGRITRSELSDTLHYSGVYLNNIAKKYTGLTLFDYGVTFCMKKAVQLILDTSMSISEISDILGFSNRTHFYKIFKDTYQVTPTQYRKAHIIEPHVP